MKRFWKMLKRPQLPYTIAERTVIGLKRYRLYLVASPLDHDLFRDMMLDAIDLSRGWTYDVAYVFIFASQEEVGAAPAIARGLWTRHGVTGPGLTPGNGGIETVETETGVFEMAVM